MTVIRLTKQDIEAAQDYRAGLGLPPIVFKKEGEHTNSETPETPKNAPVSDESTSDGSEVPKEASGPQNDDGKGAGGDMAIGEGDTGDVLPPLMAATSMADSHPSQVEYPINDVIEGVLQTGQALVLGAAGGTGKSRTRQALTLDAANGVPSLRYTIVGGTGTSMTFITEDDVEIAKMDFGAAQEDREPHELPKGYDKNNRADFVQVMNRIHVFDTQKQKLGLFKRDGSGNPYVDEEAVQRLIKTLQNGPEEKPYDLTWWDPMINVGEGVLVENDNVHMNLLMETMNRIAKEVPTAIGLVSHVSKGANGADSDSLSRGASAIRDGARIGHTLAHVSSERAEEFFIPPELAKDIRYQKCVKLTFGDPTKYTGFTRLKKFTATFKGGVEKEMVRMVAYDPPKPWEGSDKHLPKIIERLREGVGDREDGTFQLYSPQHNANSYAGKMIADVMDLNSQRAGGTVLRKYLKGVKCGDEFTASLFIEGEGPGKSSGNRSKARAVMDRAFFDVIDKSHDDNTFSLDEYEQAREAHEAAKSEDDEG